MNIYAKVGESFQQIGGTCPEDCIEMKTQRPDGFYIAGADGQWIEDKTAEFKAGRSEAVANIVVNVDGYLFDGDETSQDRMSRTITAMDDAETIEWILADDATAQVSKATLKKALRAAGEEMARLWIPPKQ